MPAYSALYALKVQHGFGNCGLECATRAFQTATEILSSPAAISNFQEYASEPRSESPFRQAWANGCIALHNQARDRRDDRQNSQGASAQLQIVSEGRADVGPPVHTEYDFPSDPRTNFSISGRCDSFENRFASAWNYDTINLRFEGGDRFRYVADYSPASAQMAP